MNAGNIQFFLAISTLIGTLVTLVSTGIAILTIRENKRHLLAQTRREEAEALAADGSNAQAVSSAWQTAMKGLEDALALERTERQREAVEARVARGRLESELRQEKQARQALELRFGEILRRMLDLESGIPVLLAQLRKNKLEPEWVPAHYPSDGVDG